MTTTFLATVIGWYMVLFGLLMLTKQEQMKSVLADVVAHKGHFFILAFITFLIGLLLVVGHNIWIASWPVSITIFSWLLFIGGLGRLFFLPEATKMAGSFIKSPKGLNVFGIFCLIFGVYLLAHVYYL